MRKNNNGNNDHGPQSSRMTPPHGMSSLSPESVSELPDDEVKHLIAIQLEEMRKANTRQAVALESHRDHFHEWRQLTADRLRRHDDLISTNTLAIVKLGQSSEASKTQFDQFKADLMVALAADKRELKDAINQVSKKVDETHALIGTLPEKVNLERLSSHGDATAEELVAAERGTGILGMLGRLVARDVRAAKQLAQEAGRSAGRSAGVVSSVVTTVATTSPVWGPPLFEAAKRVFGG